MKKIVAIILEILPILSAPVSYCLITASVDSAAVRWIIGITLFLAFFGFVFFFIGRGLAKESKAVRILGIFDWLATAFVVCLYGIAFLVAGL